MADIIALRREAGSSEPERFRDDSSKTDRVRLFEAIGAKVGLQLASNRVVFLEGKDSHADKRIIDKLAGAHLPRVLFVASGSSKNVMGAGTRAGELIAQASKESAFFMVLDRDYRDNACVESLEKRLKGRAMVWKCHEIENVLLEPSILLKVLALNGDENHTDSEGVRSVLLDAAKSLEDRFVAQFAAYRLHSKANPDDEDREPKPTDESNLLRMAEGIRNRMQVAFSEAAAKEQIAWVKNIIQKFYSDGTCMMILHGNEILDTFLSKYLSGLQLERLKEQILSIIVQEKFLPNDIKRIIDIINTL
jgi:hypothetical protein